ncbi:hypothetical protein COO60DRAFT_1623874 [Scenedesmus sp. NREL 46B-D3]|nr:hypothetical protein COO60DRAFT_1623874 [Scenedesmus sp. NREL 46B-D3]
MKNPGLFVGQYRSCAIPLPPSEYPLWDSLPAEVVEQGKLSQLQLEGVLYACTRHQQILPSGQRAGFFIGDGAGALERDHGWLNPRHLWLSTSTDLHVDAGRDLRDLGAHIPLINGCTGLDKGTRALGLAKDLQEGVLFLSSFVTKHLQQDAADAAAAALTRACFGCIQVVEWLVGGTNSNPQPQGGSSKAADAAAAAAVAGAQAWDGLVVLDECHKAKNFMPGKEAQSTKVASAVIDLQAMLPNARVLYCSATGVSEVANMSYTDRVCCTFGPPALPCLMCPSACQHGVANMAYMERMGLWGPASPFPDFNAFLESMRKRGVSFMELLAMEMKAAGRYVARGLSFRQAEFLQVEAPLSPSKVAQYDAAVELWQGLRSKLEAALQLAGIEKRDVWKTFWAAQQRFFKLLCVGLKLDTVMAEAKAALASGMCVVIGLQSTGEAAADAMGLEPGPLPGFVSPCKEMLLRFIQQNFPEHAAQSPEAAAMGLQPEGIPACRTLKHQLLAQLASLDLPPNFLDQLIDELGGPTVVAEMTGRKGRVVREQLQRNGAAGAAALSQRVAYELRAKLDSSEMDSLNVRERQAFLAGSKRVALISDAASTGISLHAAATAANRHQRRLHLTIELPWSADKAIQQLGRSHRTNQVSAPLYKLVVSAAGGERRFAAAVARRLQSLGALTRGDRRAAAGVDLSDSNFDTPWGRKSLRKMYDAIVTESPQLPSGVTVSALLKDLLVFPASSSGAGTVAAAEEALLVAALTGKAPPPAAAAAYMTPAQVGAAVAELHRELRGCCDMMGIGLSGRSNDSVVEDRLKDTVSAAAKDANAAATPAAKDLGDVRRFLNRLLGLPLGRQNLLFNYFAATLAAEIAAARAEGRYTEGVSDLQGSSISLARPPQLLWGDASSGSGAGAAAQTWANTLQVDRGVAFEDAARRLAHESFPGCLSGFRRSRRPMFGTHLVLLALQKPGQKNLFSLVRPNTGEAFYDMERAELDEKYSRAPPEAVQEEWSAQHAASLASCIHGPACASKSTCQQPQHAASLSRVQTRSCHALQTAGSAGAACSQPHQLQAWTCLCQQANKPGGAARDRGHRAVWQRGRVRHNTIGIAMLLCAASAAALSQIVVAEAQLRPGYGITAAGLEIRCRKGTFNIAGPGQRHCVSCPAGFTTLAEGTATAACFVRPGWELDVKSQQPRPCDAGSWSPGGSHTDPSGSCIKCPAGFTTQTDESAKATDCEGAQQLLRCFAAMMLADQDYFPLSDDKLWMSVAASSVEACAAACAASTGEGSGPPACIMYRWSEDSGCQQLQEQQTLPNSSLLGFKVLQGTDYVIYRVSASTTAGEQVGSKAARSLKECMAACDALNTCEVFSFPGFKAAGACRMWGSVLEAGYQSMCHAAAQFHPVLASILVHQR